MTNTLTFVFVVISRKKRNPSLCSGSDRPLETVLLEVVSLPEAVPVVGEPVGEARDGGADHLHGHGVGGVAPRFARGERVVLVEGRALEVPRVRQVRRTRGGLGVPAGMRAELVDPATELRGHLGDARARRGQAQGARAAARRRRRVGDVVVVGAHERVRVGDLDIGGLCHDVVGAVLAIALHPAASEEDHEEEHVGHDGQITQHSSFLLHLAKHEQVLTGSEFWL